MEKNLRKYIKKVITEELHIQSKVDKLALSAATKTMKIIENNVDLLDNVHTLSFSNYVRLTPEIEKLTGIGDIIIIAEILESKEFKISGKYLNSKDILNTDGTYNVHIKLGLSTPKEKIKDLFPNIESLFAHEIHHAFVYIKRKYKKSKTPILNFVNKQTLSYLKDIIKKNPKLDEFTKLFYVSLPDEISARVQEVGTQLKHINSKDKTEIYEYLLGFQSLCDTKRLIKFNLNSLLETDKDVLQTYVNMFNENLLRQLEERGMEKNYIKTISDPDKFFKYWTQYFESNGTKMLTNINSLINKKINDRFDESYAFMEGHLLSEIMGNEWRDYFNLT